MHKNIAPFAFALILFAGLASAAANYTRFDAVVVKQSMAIGTTSPANSISVLDLVSTTKGFLPPRMTNAQINAISSPPEGLVGIDTTSHFAMMYNGSAWKVFADTDSTQTFTGKLLDADSNTLTNIENADIKAAAGIAVNKLAALTADRAVVTDGSGFNSVSATTATEIGFVNGVTSSLCGINQSCTETNKTLTSPIVNGANLTFGAATNANRIILPTETTANIATLSPVAGSVTYDTTTNKPYYANGTIWTAVGSGSGGGGGREFLTNTDAETDTTGWTTYADAAGVSPVDCTGGSPASTLARSTASPLTGVGSFTWTKSANDRQGEGVAAAFTISDADKAKVLKIEFDYVVSSGTFVAGSSGVDSDQEVYIYDVTNGVIIQPSSYKLFSNSSTIADRFSGYFQTASNSTSYRICIHTATSSASAYTTKFDNLSVQPAKYAYGTPISDWTSFTPTGAWSTNTTYSGQWRRVGDSAQIRYRLLLGGAPTAASLTLNLPTGLVIDPAKVSSQTTPTIGYGQVLDSGAAQYDVVPVYLNTTSFYAYLRGTASTYANLPAIVNATTPITFGNADEVTIFVDVPIAGWSSSVQMSDSADQRVVAAGATSSAGQSITGSNADLSFNSETVDTHGAFSSPSFTVPVSGVYSLDLSIYFQSATATNGTGFAYFVQNASQIGQTVSVALGASSGQIYPGSVNILYSLNAGDVIKIVVSQNSGASVTATANLSIKRLSGPSSIGATETVAARVYAASNQAVSGSPTINLDTVSLDTHGAFNTSTYTYTVPVGGLYQVSGQITYAANTTGYRLARIVKNGSVITETLSAASNADKTSAVTSTLVRCNAGDTFTLQGEQGSGGSLDTNGGSNHVYMHIHRIGL